MKKFILVICVILFMGNQVFAYNYDAKFKKEFYDSFIANYLQSLQETLIKEGFKENNTYEYVSTLRARLNRAELEQSTWSCVSKFSQKQMAQTKNFTENCFADWSQKFMFEKNADAIDILKK